MFVGKPPLRGRVLLRKCLYLSYLKESDASCVWSLNAHPPLGACSPHLTYQCMNPLLSAGFFRLRPLDIEFMKRLSKVVNIVPVIAKADTLTLEERDYFKQRVRGWQFLSRLLALVPHPFPLLSPSLAPRAGKASSWPGAQHIPPAAALSDPTWPQERSVLQAVPCVSLGSLSVQDKFRA